MACDNGGSSFGVNSWMVDLSQGATYQGADQAFAKRWEFAFGRVAQVQVTRRGESVVAGLG